MNQQVGRERCHSLPLTYDVIVGLLLLLLLLLLILLLLSVKLGQVPSVAKTVIALSTSQPKS